MPHFKNAFHSFVIYLGQSTLNVVHNALKSVTFFIQILKSLMQRPFYGKEFLSQLNTMGYNSISLIALTALFTGMVLAFQSYTSFARFGAQAALPEVVALSLVRELAPVLSALMMAGRWGASIAAELGAMRVTDQIDALITLSVNPLSFLVFPRILAAMIALPFLTLLANSIGILGGFGVSTLYYGLHGPSYLAKTYQVILMKDISSGLVKSIIFGFIITFIGCYEGYHTKSGAQGVGLSTTRGVVRSCLFILIADSLLTAFLFSAP